MDEAAAGCDFGAQSCFLGLPVWSLHDLYVQHLRELVERGASPQKGGLQLHLILSHPSAGPSLRMSLLLCLPVPILQTESLSGTGSLPLSKVGTPCSSCLMVTSPSVWLPCSFRNYVKLCEEDIMPRHKAVEHWAKIEAVHLVPEDQDRIRMRIAQRYPVAKFNLARQRLDPKNILSNHIIDLLFPLNDSLKMTA